MEKPGKFKITFYLLLNIVASIVIILLNKWIYTHIKFPNITLSMLHFFATFFGLYISKKLNVFMAKSIPLLEIMVLALSFCGFVVLTNLSLQFNTVGTYQVTKILTTPGVILIQVLYYRKTFSTGVKLTLIPIIVGIVCNFYYDIHFNILGTVYALLGVVITSLYQVLVNSKQKELDVSSIQLLYYQAPLSGIMLCFCILLAEPPLITLQHNWTIIDLVMIVVSCIAALICNLSTYWIIGNTSPLTYNMVGHSKFVLVTLGGWLLFDSEISLNQLLGIGLTLTGLIVYTHIKMNETREPKTVEYTRIREQP